MGARLYRSCVRRPRGAEQLGAAKGAQLYASGARRSRGVEQIETAKGTRVYALTSCLSLACARRRS